MRRAYVDTGGLGPPAKTQRVWRCHQETHDRLSRAHKRVHPRRRDAQGLSSLAFDPGNLSEKKDNPSGLDP